MYIITAIPITPIPRPSEQVYSYFFKKPLKRGSLVNVPFSNRVVKALVLKSEQIGKKKIEVKKAGFALKGIESIASVKPIMSESEIVFATWFSEYFFTPLGLALKSLLPSYIFKKNNPEYESVDITKGSGFSFNYLVGPDRFKEYLQKVKDNIKDGKQTLVIFPEVLAARKFFTGLPKKIKDEAVLWGRTTPRRELEERIKILTGETKIVIGTRGATLLHLPELKTIILEDEQNSALKSWDAHPKYDVRPITNHLAQDRGLELIWGGYLPSVNAFTLIGDFNLETPFPSGVLDSKKSSISIVDMREEIKADNKTILSGELRKSLKGLVGSGKQAILLINRKGEHTVILCRDCGHVLKCSSCSSTLVSTVIKNQSYSDLFCRYCKKKQNVLDVCPNCKGHKFKFLGAGTELAQQEIKKSFPALGVLRLDSDIARAPATQERIIKDFIDSRAQILLGTQMVIKPNVLLKVSLSAIISLETMLYLPEYNGEEKVFMSAALLENMSQDKFIWQTYQPAHRIVELLKTRDYLGFLQEELLLRKKFTWPPYSRLIRINWYDKDKERAKNQATFLYNKLNTIKEDRVFIYEPFEFIAHDKGGRYAFSMILKVNPKMPLNERNNFLSYIPSKWEVDIDPAKTL